MFSEAPVSHSVHRKGGVCGGGGEDPLEADPPDADPLDADPPGSDI